VDPDPPQWRDRRGLDGLRPGQPRPHCHVPRVGNHPVPLHLDQPDPCLRVPHLEARPHAVGAGRGHAADSGRHRGRRAARARTAGGARRGAADGDGVPRDGLARPPQANGRALLPADRGADRPDPGRPAAVSAGRRPPAADPNHDRARPCRVAGQRAGQRPARGRGCRGHHRRADPAPADLRPATHHRRRCGPHVPAPGAGRPRRAGHGAVAALAARRQPALANRHARERDRPRGPGAARAGARRSDRERRQAYLQ
jgi:hypothetical protein